MGIDLEELFQKVRGGQFDRSPVLQDLLRERAWAFTKAELVQAAHRYKAWQGLRGRLAPGQVRAARAAGEGWAVGYDQYVELLRRVGELPRFRRRIEDVEDAIVFLYDLVRDLGDLAPLRSSSSERRGYATWQPGTWSFAGYAEETRRDLPPELLTGLLGILGELTRKFLTQLEEVGRFEVPAILPAPVEVTIRQIGERDPTAGLAGFGLRELRVLETGDVIVMSANPGAGASVSVISPALHGPSVVERMFWAQDGNITGDFQAMVQPGGIGVPAAAGPVGISGDSLFLAAAGTGVAGSRVQVAPFVTFGEWWPRRFIPYSGFHIVLTITNTGGVPGFGALSVDRRDVVRAAS